METREELLAALEDYLDQTLESLSFHRETYGHSPKTFGNSGAEFRSDLGLIRLTKDRGQLFCEIIVAYQDSFLLQWYALMSFVDEVDHLPDFSGGVKKQALELNEQFNQYGQRIFSEDLLVKRYKELVTFQKELQKRLRGW